MELTDAIALAKAGGCLLFTGAGFSAAATNTKDEPVPTAKKFARDLAFELGVDPDYSLEIIGEYAIRGELGEHGLINKLITTFAIKETTPDQDFVSSIQWKRVYTTNYDMAFEISARKAKQEWSSLTLAAGPTGERARCIHINGHIHNLSIETLRSQIKLTHSSYASNDFAQSPWATQFRADMANAPAVFFIGYSMADMDIARVLFHAPELLRKTFFIIAQGAPPPERQLLEAYGRVEPIGLSGFVQVARNVEPAPHQSKSTYSWLQAIREPDAQFRPLDRDAIHLLTLGDIREEAIAAAISDPDILYTIRRSVVTDVVQELDQGRRWFLLHSALGNGKTLLKYQLAYALRAANYEVLIDSDYDSGIVADCRQLSQTTKKTAVLVDEAGNRLEAIKHLRAADNGSNVFFVFTRTNLFELDARYERGLPEGFRLYDLNKLDREEITALRILLDSLGLWGDRAAEAGAHKDEYIRIHCASEFANVILSIFEETDVGTRIKRAAQSVLATKSDVGRMIVLAFLMENAEHRPRLSIVSEVLNKDAWALSRKPEFTAAGEFLYLRNQEIATRSSIVARFVLRNAIRGEVILDYIADFVERFDVLRRSDKRLEPLFREFQRFAFLESLVKSSRKRELLIGYYERLKSLPGCMRNPLFWLQYAIARLSFEQYREAEIYFKTSYSFAKDGQDWYLRDIDNHYSRLLLESRINTEDYTDYYDAFKEAHSKLYGQMLKGDNRHYPYRQARNYVAFIVARKSALSPSQRQQFASACRQVIKNIIELSTEMARHRYIRECKEAMERAISIAESE